MPDGGDALVSGLTDVGTNIIAPAAVGAGVGAATAAATGGDPGTGALIGGGTGAVGGGINWAAGGSPITSMFDSAGGGEGTSGAPQVAAPASTALADLGVSPAPAAAAPGIGAAGGGSDLTGGGDLATGGGFQATASQVPAAPADPSLLNTGGGGGGTVMPPAGGGGGPSGFSKVIGTLKDLGIQNPLAAGISGLGLVANVAQGDRNPTGQPQMKGIADTLSGQGTTLSQYINTGTLPPGAQQALSAAANAAKVRIRAKYASLGMSGSTAEVQEINNVDMQVQAQGFQLADQLLKTGIDESNLAAGIYKNLVGIDEQQTSSTGTAIANFAAALAGSRLPKDTTSSTGA